MLKFLAMGGYAAYVWPSYALTLIVLGLNILWARRSLRQAQSEARRRLAMSAREPLDVAATARSAPGASPAPPVQP